MTFFGFDLFSIKKCQRFHFNYTLLFLDRLFSNLRIPFFWTSGFSVGFTPLRTKYQTNMSLTMLLTPCLCSLCQCLHCKNENISMCLRLCTMFHRLEELVSLSNELNTSSHLRWFLSRHQDRNCASSSLQICLALGFAKSSLSCSILSVSLSTVMMVSQS